MDGKVALKAENRDTNLGSTSFLPPPAYIYSRHTNHCITTCIHVYIAYIQVHVCMYMEICV